VSVKRGRWREERTEHVEFTVRVDKGEEFILRRLEREKRVGTVEKLGAGAYRFSADVYEAGEMIPWVRTFLCRITDFRCSNRAVEAQFKKDPAEMYRIYGIGEEGEG
jgi:hypothetical protein